MMAFIAFLFSLGLFLPCVYSEIHTLDYVYTALSKPVEVPGVYEFTAMGLLNDKQIDYYDSKNKIKIPKQHWMKERLQSDYWEKGTQSRKSKEQWFKVNVGILMERMRHNSSGLHILQWNHGCTINKKLDGSIEFMKGTDRYSYDGEDFLSFDEANMQWVAPTLEAEPTKRKWDGVQILNQYTKGYLEKECVDWLSKFIEYGKKAVVLESPPDVHAFAKMDKNPEYLLLTCMATGFYPKDVNIEILKDGTVLTSNDGVMSTGVRPNGVNDDTYQIRKSVEVLGSDTNGYECLVQHSSLKEPIKKKWDGTCVDCDSINMPLVIGLVVAVLLILVAGAVGVFLYLRKKGKIGNSSSSSSSSSSSVPVDPNAKESLLKGNSSSTSSVPVDPNAKESLLKGKDRDSQDSGQGSSSNGSPTISTDSLGTEQ